MRDVETDRKGCWIRNGGRESDSVGCVRTTYVNMKEYEGRWRNMIGHV